MMSKLLFTLCVALLTCASAPGRQKQSGAQDTRAKINRQLEAIEWALKAIQSKPGDAELLATAESRILEATEAIRELIAKPAPGAARHRAPVPEGPWVDAQLVGARGPFARVLVSDYGWNPLKERWFTLESADLAGRQRGVGIVSSHYEGMDGKPLAWSHVRVRGAIDAAGSPRSRWGLIVFDVEDWSFSECTWVDIPDEHGVYATTLGGVRWERCLFEDIGSQGVQLVGAVPGTPRAEQTAHREDWQAYSDARRGQAHEFIDCVFFEVGKPTGGRPSYAISAFEGPRNPVLVERCVMRTSDSRHKDRGGVVRDCYGAVMAHDRDHFELLDSYIEYLNGDREVVQVWNCSDGKPGTPDVVIRGCRVLASQPVDVRIRPGDTVVIEGNVGSTAQLRISTNPPKVWPGQAGWDPARVLYAGPLAVDYKLD